MTPIGESGSRGDDSHAPSLARWLTEPLCLPKIAAAPFRDPVETNVRAAGTPVIVLPGMASGDRSTALLRNSLSAAGFKPRAGGLGRNMTVSTEKFQSLETLLADAVEKEGKRAILIGWSLGGFYTRVLARRHPDKVALVATLGTPFSGSRRANNAWRLYELLADHPVDAPPLPDDPAIKPPVPTLAFWSPVDGVVAPASARGLPGERDAAIELPFRHFEMGCSRRAVKQIIEEIGSQLPADGA